MPNPTVADLIRKWKQETGLTPAAVHERARQRGFKVSAGYIDDLANGRTDNPTPRLMKAVAAGFGKPVEELVARAMGWDYTENDLAPLFREMSELYRQLSPAKQKEKRLLLEMLNRELQREL